MPYNPGICFKNIHENDIHQDNRGKNNAFVIMVNNFSLGDLGNDVSRKK